MSIYSLSVLTTVLALVGVAEGFLGSSPLLRDEQWYVSPDLNVTGCSYQATCT